ncbi:hypothetical protein PoMZ_02134 [Pyricularia oryzae]|uniref:Lon protease homolog 2, peroxisomal n=1 Tax=Pyricularia oryzae TaxID=318829 RepID=A0A4P7NAK8_PYROR|nr:hypothetical protein PoMZ_02134 [Pyricularia oryzae]
MAPSESSLMAIVPLASGSVLLPGVMQRIPVGAKRADIISLVGSLYGRAPAPGRIDTIPIACVPIASPLLGANGQRLIRDKAKSDVSTARPRRPVDYSTLQHRDVFSVGVVAKITAVEAWGSEDAAILVDGVARMTLESLDKDLLRAHYEGHIIQHEEHVPVNDKDLQRRFERLKTLARELIDLLRLTSITSRPRLGLDPVLARRLDSYMAKRTVADAGSFADFVGTLVDCAYEDKLEILATFDVKQRVDKVIELLDRTIGGLKSITRITTVTAAVPMRITDAQNPNLPPPFIRRGVGPFSAPHNVQGGQEPEEKEPDETEELQKKLDDAKLSPEAAKVAAREMKRLKKMMPVQAEYSVLRTYLETLAEIPWSLTTDDRLDKTALGRARKQLDDDHHGLSKVKQRLVEYLAVLRLKQSANEEIDAQIKRIQEEMVPPLEGESADYPEPGLTKASQESLDAAQAKIDMLKSRRMTDKSPILLLAGPPGVGKTSLAKSVATALGRKFHRISLGGVRDEAEIRGHRRTYVAAMPGLIIQGLKKTGVSNPVILLDEIDKISQSNHHGDPSAAMLEVLDPEQNATFVDHFINIPVDLSKVLFIATANSLETIPPPLLDRLEMIYLSGYTTLEKRHIATNHLVPKQIRANGLSPEQIVFPEEVVSKIIESYTREAGVRNLEREIGSVCRAKAVEYADAKDDNRLDQYRAQLTVEDIEHILGSAKYEDEIAEQEGRPGVVTGLVAYSSGGNGSILFIEVADMPGDGSVQHTGQLGDVLKESARVALSWVKANAFQLGLSPDPREKIMENRSIHVHCPAGAIPKDGPSSGIAQAIALISLFSGKIVPPTMAMTGEISLRGRVTAVGGIKEKLIGALRAGVKTVLLPKQNEKDVQDLPQEVKDGLKIILVSEIWEAIRHVWPEEHFPGEPKYPGLYSRL